VFHHIVGRRYVYTKAKPSKTPVIASGGLSNEVCFRYIIHQPWVLAWRYRYHL